MPANFFSLPGEIRDNIYEELLLLSEPIVLETTMDISYDISVLSRFSSAAHLYPALLLANKRVHSEASPVLYSRNRFVCAPEYESEIAVLTSFLDGIGRQNASFIRHISIAFPAFDDCKLGSVTLQEDSIRVLELLRDRCTNLTTLETSPLTTSDMEFTLDTLDSPQTVDEALALVDAHFRAIQSLKEIIANVYEDPPSDDMRGKIHGCGWTILMTEQEQSDNGIGLPGAGFFLSMRELIGCEEEYYRSPTKHDSYCERF